MAGLINSYSWDPGEYAQHSSEQLGWAQELFRKIQVTGSENLLDIGCGDGRVTAWLANHLPHGSVTGIDSSSEMVIAAQNKFPESQYPNLQFRRMDATRISFPRIFDLSFSNATLHWVADHLAVLNSLKECLVNSGKIVFQMGGEGNAAQMIRTINNIIGKDRWGQYFQDFTFPYWFYGIDDYQAWLNQVGFQGERVELVTKDMVHQGKGGLAGWIRSAWLPYVERVPRDQKEHFISEIVDAYIDKTTLDDLGFAHVKMIRLEVEAINQI